MSRAILATLLLLAACDEAPIETATISALREPCFGEGTQLCLTMTEDGAAPHRLFGGIEGFTHRWGVESEITFRREEVDNPPADASSIKLVLVDTIVENDLAVGAFTLNVPGGAGGGWFAGTGTELNMVGTTVVCEQAICDQLIAADNGDPFSITMELVDGQTLRATAVTVP